MGIAKRILTSKKDPVWPTLFPDERLATYLAAGIGSEI
jgi:hypothetical protein